MALDFLAFGPHPDDAEIGDELNREETAEKPENKPINK